MASMFSQLLEKTHQQPEQQRLLFLFASTEQSKKSRKRQDGNGTITPTMVVDKLPEELTDFKSLVNEADSINRDWDFIFIAGLSGDQQSAPTTEEAEPYLNNMTNDVVSGNNIHRYVVLDRQENPIEIMAG